MRVPLPIQLDVSAPNLLDLVSALPGSAGIYVLGTPGQSPHLSWCSNLRTRLRRLLIPNGTGNQSLLANLREHLAGVQCWSTASKLESALMMHALAKQYFPADYLVKLRLRMPWFLTLSSESGFPRLVVSNRPSSTLSPLMGPFVSRDLAHDYEERILGLFQLRRCVESFVPSPQHPGCIYGEMSQCLRPCQAAVTPEEYASEAARVGDFLLTNGKNVITSLLLARDRAAAATDFEQAAFLHRRLEKMKDTAHARDSVIDEVGQFGGIALTRGAQSREIRLFPMLEGYWQEPLTLSFAAEQSRSNSLDGELKEKVRDALTSPVRDRSRVEDLAIFSRWYYSSWRDGHWLPFRTLGDVNYRKLVREISNMVKADPQVPLHGTPC